MTIPTRVRYVNRDHGHRLYGQEGVVLVRSSGGGPRNCLVRLDSGEEVVAPFWNWRKVKEATP
jgi:hypothetical protein